MGAVQEAENHTVGILSNQASCTFVPTAWSARSTMIRSARPMVRLGMAVGTVVDGRAMMVVAVIHMVAMVVVCTE